MPHRRFDGMNPRILWESSGVDKGNDHYVRVFVSRAAVWVCLAVFTHAVHSETFRTAVRFTATNLTNNVALYKFLSTFSGTHFVSPRNYQVNLRFAF
jgi:hypothetical protein